MTISTFQDFHAGKIEDFELKTNFHLSAGGFNTKIPFTTFEPDDRKRQLIYAIPPQSGEMTYRAYLLAFGGIGQTGSCVDFKPFIPKNTKAIDIEVIDLLQDSSSGEYYQDSDHIDLK